MNASLIAATTAPTPLAASKAATVQSDAAAKADFHQLLRQASSGGSTSRQLPGGSNTTPASSPQWSRSTLQSATEQPATEPSPETPASPNKILSSDTAAFPDSGQASSPQQSVVTVSLHTADTKDIVVAVQTDVTEVASALAQSTVPVSSSSGKGIRGESGKMSRPTALAQTGKHANASQVQTQGVNLPTQSAPLPVVIAQWIATPSLSGNASSPGTDRDASLQTAPAGQQGSTGILVPHDGAQVTDNAATTSVAATPVNPASTPVEQQSELMGKAKYDAAILPASVTDTPNPYSATPGSPALPIGPAQVATPAQSTTSTKDAAILSVNTAGTANQNTNVSPGVPPELAQVAISAGSAASAAQVLTTGTAKAATQPSPIPVSKSSKRATPQNNAARTGASRGAASDVPAGKSLETSSVKTKTSFQDISATKPETATSAVSYAREGDSASSNSARIGHKKVDAAVKSTPDTKEDTSSISAGTEQSGSASATLGVSAHIAPIAQVTATPQITSAVPDAPLSTSAILQGVQGVPSAPANAAQSSASPAFTAHASTQSAPVAEPPHGLNAAQLHVHGDVSELKISVQLPVLGKVEVRAVSTHDATTAHITAAHDALPVFAAGRSGLEEVLKLHDVTLGSFGSPAQGQSNGQSSQQSFQRPAPSQDSAAPETAIDSVTSEADRSSFLPDHTSISVRA